MADYTELISIGRNVNQTHSEVAHVIQHHVTLGHGFINSIALGNNALILIFRDIPALADSTTPEAELSQQEMLNAFVDLVNTHLAGLKVPAAYSSAFNKRVYEAGFKDALNDLLLVLKGEAESGE